MAKPHGSLFECTQLCMCVDDKAVVIGDYHTIHILLYQMSGMCMCVACSHLPMSRVYPGKYAHSQLFSQTL